MRKVLRTTRRRDRTESLKKCRQFYEDDRTAFMTKLAELETAYLFGSEKARNSADSSDPKKPEMVGRLPASTGPDPTEQEIIDLKQQVVDLNRELAEALAFTDWAKKKLPGLLPVWLRASADQAETAGQT